MKLKKTRSQDLVFFVEHFNFVFIALFYSWVIASQRERWRGNPRKNPKT